MRFPVLRSQNHSNQQFCPEILSQVFCCSLKRLSARRGLLIWVPLASGSRILVSSARKPVSYINLAKRFLSEHGEVQLSALGIAIAPAVTVAEILKSRGLAVERRIVTGLETLVDDNRTRQKPKMEIVLTKSADFESIVARETEQAPAAARLEGLAQVQQGLGELDVAVKEDDE